MTTNRHGRIQIYRMADSRAWLLKDVILADLGGSLRPHHLISAHYVPHDHSLATFYDDTGPRKMSLGARSIAVVRALAPVPGESPDVLHRDGFISTEHGLWIVPTTDPRRPVSTITVHALDRPRVLSHHVINGDAGLIALSTDGRLLAVQLRGTDRILIFDLSSKTPGAAAELRSGIKNLDRLTFISESTLALSTHDLLPRTVRLPIAPAPRLSTVPNNAGHR